MPKNVPHYDTNTEREKGGRAKYRLEMVRAKERRQNRRLHEMYIAHKANKHKELVDACPKCLPVTVE